MDLGPMGNPDPPCWCQRCNQTVPTHHMVWWFDLYVCYTCAGLPEPPYDWGSSTEVSG